MRALDQSSCISCPSSLQGRGDVSLQYVFLRQAGADVDAICSAGNPVLKYCFVSPTANSIMEMGDSSLL